MISATLLLLSLYFCYTTAKGGFDDDNDGGFDATCGGNAVDDYDYVIVGGGSGGIGAAYWLSDALKRANRPVSIAVIEKNDYLGGNVFDFDLVQPPSNRYDGSFGPKLRGGLGALRTTQLAMGLKRRLVSQLNLTMYFTPFRNYVNMRGVRRLCRDPIKKAFELAVPGTPGDFIRYNATSKQYEQQTAILAQPGDFVRNPSDAYAYGDFCNNLPPYVDADNDDGSVFRGFSTLGADARNRGPSDAAWRYVLHNVPHLTGQSDMDRWNGWIFDYGGVHPFTDVTCEDGISTPACPYSRKNNLDWKTFLETELRTSSMIALNQNYSAFMLDDNVGFTGDFDNGFSARSYLEYNLFEWNTNSFNGYLKSGESELINALVNAAKARGVKFFTGERVKSVDKTSAPGVRYMIATSKRTVRARKFALLNLPPFYLFDRMDQDPIVEYDGVDLGGGVINSLRSVREMKVPQPTRAIKIVAQWPPGKKAWWWDLLDNKNGNYSLRQYGTTGCTSRIEFEDTPKHRCTNEVTVVYSDRQCRRKWQAYAEDAERTGDYTTFGDVIVQEMKAAFPEVAHKITTRPVLIKFKLFNSAWHIGKMSYDDISSEQLATKSAAPLGSSERVGLIGEAYFTRRSGWIEGSLRSAKNLVTRIASMDGFSTRMSEVFDDLFDYFRDLDGEIGDSSAYRTDFAGPSAMGYIPPAYPVGDRDLTQMEPNERWGPYGDYSNPSYQQDSCRPSLYGIKI